MFKELLDQLAGEMGTELTPDRNHTCLIQFEDGTEVSIEPYKEEALLLIGLQLGDLGSGAGRMKMFESALIANGLPYPRFGTFAWSRQTNQLILHTLFPMEGLTGKMVKDEMMGIVEKGREWAEAIKRGAPPVQPRLKE
jgi:Tir chaperone protein (CesT) family